MINIRVDFNSVDGEGYVRSAISRADGDIQVGEVVLAYDTEGHDCLAEVHSVSPEGRVALQIHPTEWNDPLDIPDEPGVATALELYELSMKYYAPAAERAFAVAATVTTTTSSTAPR